MNVHSIELTRQHGAHMERRKRMEAAANSNSEVERLHRQLRLMNLKVESLQHELATKTETLKALHSDLADAHARILSQAKVICDRGTEDDVDGEFPPKRSVPEIVKEVLEDYPGVTWADIISLRRTRDLIEPRHACFKAVYYERKDLGPERIGHIFHRDRTTILHAVGQRPDRKKVLSDANAD